MAERFEKHARTVSLLTLVSRFTGLARDAVLSRVFGARGLMDAFFLAFLIPNLFRRLFGEGALAAAFVPVYTELDRDDPETARRLATLTIGRLVILLGVITLILEGALLAASLTIAQGNLAAWLMMIMLPYMPLVCVVAILGAMLQVHGRFGPTAAAPIVLNVCLIGAAVGFVVLGPSDSIAQSVHIAAVSGSVLLAGVLQVVWSMWALNDREWWTGMNAARTHDAKASFNRVWGQALPMILGLGVFQLNTLFDGLIASYPTVFGDTIFGVAYPLDEGSMAAISFSQRLYQFPLGVFGIAIATAIFPLLARQANDGAAFSATLRRGLRLVVFIGLPASAGIMLVREELAAVILQGGAFGDEDTARVGRILLGYSPAIWAYSMTHVLTRAFYAKGDSKTPVKVALGVVLLNVILNCTLIWTPLREAGLAWSTAISAVVQVMILLKIARRHVDHAVDGEVVRSWARSLGVTLVMAAIVWVTGFSLEPASDWFGWLTRLLAMVAAGAVAVGCGAAALRMPEWKWALGGRGG